MVGLKLMAWVQTCTCWSSASCVGPGLFSDTASVIWDDIEVICIVFLGGSNVSSQGGAQLDNTSLCKVDGGDSLYTWFEVEHESQVGTHICHLGLEGHDSIVNFNLEVG